MSEKTINIDYTIDLQKLEGDREFNCPKCNSLLSPNDESEMTYKILDAEIIEPNNKYPDGLKAIILKCHCNTIIKLLF